MNAETIKAIVDELQEELAGHRAGKIFQLTALTLAIDFRLRGGRYLFVSADPSLPGLYLINRHVRELEKQSIALSQFALLLHKELSGLAVQSVTKDHDDRIVRFGFGGHDEIGQERARTLIAQLTGRAANLFLLDEGEALIGLLRPSHRSGQQPGEQYQPPASATPHLENAREVELLRLLRGATSPSAVADTYYQSLMAEQDFAARAANARAQLRRKIAHNEKLLKGLQEDLAGHDDADQHKHFGDLLLANLSTAVRQGARVKLIDYFDERALMIEIEMDENSTLQEEAARRFAMYSRSKRAAGKIKARVATVEPELNQLRAQWEQLTEVVSKRDEAALEALAPTKSKLDQSARAPKKSKEKVTGVRRYLSSDGLEILVGRAAHDNDNLTFKVARPNDLWLHTSDYPGSHVVVRNPTRKDIPHRTIIEAAQLAAFFSHARKDAKVVVHYTPRKFLIKPRGAAPGTVRMSRSKSITVAPREVLKRL
jgi:predicted ribosome quality control (RQC) complex YloA/Tae2 family protein